MMRVLTAVADGLAAVMRADMSSAAPPDTSVIATHKRQSKIVFPVASAQRRASSFKQYFLNSYTNKLARHNRA
jgi:hypothetical protein